MNAECRMRNEKQTASRPSSRALTSAFRSSRPSASVPSLCLVAACALFLVSSCRSTSVGEGEGARGVVVVNAPAAGVVRRVFVREGMTVEEGSPVVEIAVPSEQQPAAPRAAATEDPQARASRQIQAAQNEVEAARAEVVRTEVEVQRLTPLVATGAATQAQLDGARAEYERAQQRFQQAQASSQNAQSGLVVARQQQAQGPAHAAPPPPSEKLVTANATSAGTVSAVTARVGDRVTLGQPLATLRAGQ